LLSFIILKDDSFFYRTNIHGSLAVCAAINVAVKQYLPDSILLTTPAGRLKNTHLPACTVLGASVLIALGLLRWVALLQILFGIQIGWIYLRFLQAHDDGEPRGDSSEHFAWATLKFNLFVDNRLLREILLVVQWMVCTLLAEGAHIHN
uniref:Inorganic phosphate cotransporter n=1 Tax=Gongylonema pulchrum TaxID=637853 RepID=A0A183D9B3_9BILA